jgi:hypothetical protein
VPPLADDAEERAELQRVLRSRAFSRSPAISRLLAHVCERSFAGFDHELKESTIAVELFGRPPDFDPREDPIVRVTANRLRDALLRFYRKDGDGPAVRIGLPVGQYVPVFEPVAPATEAVLPTAEPGLPETPSSPEPPRLRPVALLALAAACGLLTGYVLFAAGPVPTAASRKAWEAGLGAPFVDSGVRLLAGSSRGALDPLGHWWQPDAYYDGGVATPLPEVGAAGGHPAYRAARTGRFDYSIPLPPGQYELRLHFIETEFGDGNEGGETRRMFDVAVNGRLAIHDLDVVADAGGSRTADVKVLTGVTPAADGRLHLRFGHVFYTAMLSGIEVLPGNGGRMRPLRLTAQSVPYVSSAGLVWWPDHFAKGGTTAVRDRPVAGTPEPGLYRAERFGHFRYTIPAAPGRYRLSLAFVETFFGPANGIPVGAGARAFDVFCNGEALVRELDVLQEAGGENRALVRTFDGLEPNAQGKLILDFVPVRNLAMLSALELQPE